MTGPLVDRRVVLRLARVIADRRGYRAVDLAENIDKTRAEKDLSNGLIIE